jgi:photosystem II stability/assembly factor-like uncharacterized protein
MTRLAALAVALAFLVPAACSSNFPEPRSSRPSLLASAAVAPAYTSPATWRYHPQKPAKLWARRALGDGRVLYAGDRGERWIADASGHSVRTAARLAPEPLIAILKAQGGDWLFVGESGTAYEAQKPLGPFLRSSAPLDRLARVTAAASTILGVRRDGALVRSADAGASWQRVGPKGQRFSDVELDDAGHGVAIAIPEQLWRTDDAGATWKKAATKAFGVLSVLRDAAGRVHADSALGWWLWQPDKAPHWIAERNAPHGRAYKLPVAPPRGPDAAALASGRAVVIGERYFEVTLRTHAKGWELWSGPPSGPLEGAPLKVNASCTNLRLAGFGNRLYLACPDADSATLNVDESLDGAKTWKRQSYLARARPDDFSFAAGAGGALLVTGICAEQSSSRGCMAEGVYYRRAVAQDAGASADGGRHDHVPGTDYELAPSATPALAGTANALVFSTDGRIAYAIGRRTKDDHFAVFASHDGGRTFQAREIERIPAGGYGNSTMYPWQRRATYQVESATAAENGTLGIVFQRYGRSTLVVTDDEGHTLSVAAPPTPEAEIGAVGTRALAVAEHANQAWESLDGGASWNPIGTPLALCSGDHCDATVRCYLGGCVVGSELSRIGWRGQSDEQTLLAPRQTASPDLYDRHVRTPLSCTLDDVPWRALPGASDEPGAAQAELGKVVWFLGTSDPERASAGLFHGYGGAHPRIEHVTLLAPARHPQDTAYMMSTQVEGAAALRYTIPGRGGAPDLRNVELAWENLFEGHVEHAHLANAGGYDPGDYVGGSGAGQTARPALLSIAAGGIYLKPHANPRDGPTYFFDGHSVVTVPDVKWPALATETRSEMIHVGKHHMPVMFVGQVAAVIGARAGGAPWTLDAYSVGLTTPTDFGLIQTWDLTYLHDHSGLYLTLFDASDEVHQARFFPFEETGNVLGAPIAVPTQLDVRGPPQRCGTSDRSSAPRIIASWEPGTRHPVIVTDSTEPLRVLLTNSAVMYGTPASPCVAAFDADVVPLETNNGETQSERAILPIDELEHSWLFRVVPNPNGHGSRVEARTMNCRFDPTAEVPPEVYTRAGTKVLRR